MKRIPYLIVSLLIVTVLLLIACAPSDGDGDGDGQVPECGTPEYGGGTLILTSSTGGVTGGDPGQDPRETGQIDALIFDRLLMRDQSKGIGTAITLDGFLGCLLESWEEVSPTHFILHVRHGVKWQNLPPVNGRELTADDILYCINRFLGLGNRFNFSWCGWSLSEVIHLFGFTLFWFIPLCCNFLKAIQTAY
jgi:ABC-type transport system substrate-binding protein